MSNADDVTRAREWLRRTSVNDVPADSLATLLSAVRAEEREANAMVCEDFAYERLERYADWNGQSVGLELMDRIRARGTPTKETR